MAMKQNGYADLIILGTHIHCQGCAGEVIESLRGFEGVEDVKVDSNEHRVYVKGKQADPLRVLERVRCKCKNKYVELIHPIPKPKPAIPAEPKNDDEDVNEPPTMIIVIKILIHCENCAQETKSCIMGMKGVQMVTIDTQNKDEMTVIGAIEPQNLVNYLYKKARKHATIVKFEYQDKGKGKKVHWKQNTNQKDSKPGDTETKKEKENENEKDVYYHYPPQYNPDPMFPCLVLNDENPQACNIM